MLKQRSDSGVPAGQGVQRKGISRFALLLSITAPVVLIGILAMSFGTFLSHNRPIATSGLGSNQLVARVAEANTDTNCSPNGIMPGGEGSEWLGGGGVNICNNGPSINDDYGHSCVSVSGAPQSTNCPTGTVYAGEEWQCVELVNRLYLTKGWIKSTWWGNGSTLIYHLPSGLTYQLNGSISYINPGDVITFTDSSDSAGHAAIVNSVVNGTINIINQNAPLNSSGYISRGSLSGGNAYISMHGWAGFTVQAIVHGPNTGSSWAGVGGQAQYVASVSLTPGQRLNSDQYLVSSNVMYVLIMQTDGNLVLYHGPTALWNSGTYGHPGAYFNVQTDGNLVVYSAANVALWSSGTAGKHLGQLRLQEDGNLVAYTPSFVAIWATNTGGRPTFSYFGSNTLNGNQKLQIGQYLRSADNRYALLLQTDGNLVLYGPGYHVLWSAGTPNQNVAYAIMQTDGNLVLYTSHNVAVWSTGTSGHGSSFAIVQTDGNFVVYTSAKVATWSSGTSGEI
jgi:hypothetical protein